MPGKQLLLAAAVLSALALFVCFGDIVLFTPYQEDEQKGMRAVYVHAKVNEGNSVVPISLEKYTSAINTTHGKTCPIRHVFYQSDLLH
jgi:hypothetical protein